LRYYVVVPAVATRDTLTPAVVRKINQGWTAFFSMCLSMMFAMLFIMLTTHAWDPHCIRKGGHKPNNYNCCNYKWWFSVSEHDFLRTKNPILINCNILYIFCQVLKQINNINQFVETCLLYWLIPLNK
jgi:hypothetical protein